MLTVSEKNTYQVEICWAFKKTELTKFKILCTLSETQSL